MATKKQYAYYIQGKKIGIIEKNTSSNISASEYGEYTSPVESVANGLEVVYSYAPIYRIDETEDKDTALDTYLSIDGLLKVIDSASDNYSSAPQSLSDGSYIVLKKAGKFNGLHKVKDAGAGYITLYTKYTGSATVEKAFEESPEVYYNVTAMEDESFDLDLSRTESMALIYYIKARIAEDIGEIKLREFLMRQFKKSLEKSVSSRKKGPSIIQGFTRMR